MTHETKIYFGVGEDLIKLDACIETISEFSNATEDVDVTAIGDLMTRSVAGRKQALKIDMTTTLDRESDAMRRFFDYANNNNEEVEFWFIFNSDDRPLWSEILELNRVEQITPFAKIVGRAGYSFAPVAGEGIQTTLTVTATREAVLAPLGGKCGFLYNGEEYYEGRYTYNGDRCN